MTDTESALVTVGRVGRPHGVHGAFVVERPSESADRFALGATLLVAGRSATIVESKVSGGRRVIRLDVPVERGAELTVERGALPPPDDDAFYVFQLVGLEVVDEKGATIGRVKDIAPGVANDVVELDNGLAFPFVDDWVPEVDVEAGRMVVRAGRLGD